MKWVERVFFAILCVGAIFKFLHYPGGSILLIVPMATLSLVYCYFGFLLFNGIKFRHIFKKSAYAKASVWSIFGAVYMGVAMSTMLLGILFRVQYYPGAVVMLLTGTIFMGAGIVVYVLKLMMSGSHFIKKNWFRVAPLFLIGLYMIVSMYSGGSYQQELKEREAWMEQQRQEELERFNRGHGVGAPVYDGYEDETDQQHNYEDDSDDQNYYEEEPVEGDEW